MYVCMHACTCVRTYVRMYACMQYMFAYVECLSVYVSGRAVLSGSLEPTLCFCTMRILLIVLVENNRVSTARLKVCYCTYSASARKLGHEAAVARNWSDHI